MELTKKEREDIAYRIARALTDAYARTNELPNLEELQQAVMYVLETTPAHINKLCREAGQGDSR